MPITTNQGVSIFILAWGLLVMVYHRSFARVILAQDEFMRTMRFPGANQYTLAQAVFLTRMVAAIFILAGTAGIIFK